MSIKSIKTALGLGAVTGVAGLIVGLTFALIIAAAFGLPSLIVWLGWKFIAVSIFKLPSLSYWTVLFGMWALSALVSFLRR